VSDLPLVSVVVPVLNRVRYVGPTIDSILGQDYPRIECIVVDGGSTDGTLDVVRSYGERLRWLSRPDRGAFDAINDGWKLSRGEVLAWLNADDLWVVPGAVSTAVAYLQEHPEVDVVYGDCGGIDEEGRRVWYGPARQWDLRRAVLECDHIVHQPAAFMRRAIVERVGWLYPSWGHDHDLWLRVAVAGGTLQPIAVHLADGRIWMGNQQHDAPATIAAKVGLTRRILADPGLPEDLRRRRRRILSNAYLRCLDYLRLNRPRHWIVALRLVRQAVLADPVNSPRALARPLKRLFWKLLGQVRLRERSRRVWRRVRASRSGP
jgi:glycosyltransferase involved in cell wall biosynthesis